MFFKIISFSCHIFHQFQQWLPGKDSAGYLQQVLHSLPFQLLKYLRQVECQMLCRRPYICWSHRTFFTWQRCYMNLSQTPSFYKHTFSKRYSCQSSNFILLQLLKDKKNTFFQWILTLSPLKGGFHKPFKYHHGKYHLHKNWKLFLWHISSFSANLTMSFSRYCTSAPNFFSSKLFHGLFVLFLKAPFQYMLQTLFHQTWKT